MRQSLVSLRYRLLLLFIAGVVVVLDQLTKSVVREHLTLFQTKPFLAHWNWVLVYNEGSAFGFLANQGGWQKIFFGVIAVAVAICLIFYILRQSYRRLTGLGFSYILGGAIGNLLDRVLHGRVTDFIDWYAGNYHWPAFNLADSFITVGVAFLIIDNLFNGKSQS